MTTDPTLKERLKGLMTIALGPKALFDDPATVRPVYEKIAYRGVSTPNPDRNGTELVKDLYFPKEFNKEQVEIIERLEQSDGVVAQGPPGTGKTHTIANVICHYLATGKRILVTSKGEQALKVLKEKLPEPLRPLAISLLSNDKEALKEMEASVSAIFHKIQSVKQQDLDDEIARLKRRIDKACARIAEYENEIKDWARKQLTEITFDGKRILPEALSKQLVQDFAAHTWFDDSLPSSKILPAMTDEEIRGASKSRVLIGNDLPLAGVVFPAMDKLPDIERLVDIHRDLLTCKDLDLAGVQKGLLREQGAVTKEKIDLIEQILPQLTELLSLSQAEAEDYWLWKLWEDISKDARSGLSSETRQAIHNQVEGLSGLEKARAGFVTNPVFLPQDFLDNSHFLGAVGRCAKGAKPFGYLESFSKTDVKKALAAVTISGATPASAEDWQHVERFVAFCAEVRKSVVRWNALAAEFGGCEIQGDALSASKALHAISYRVLSVFHLANTVWPNASKILSMIFPGADGQFQPETLNRELPRVIDSLRHVLLRARLRVAEEERDALLRYLPRFGASSIEGMIDFVSSRIGNPDLSKDEIGKIWGAMLDENRRIQNLKPEFDTLLAVAKKVKTSGAPKWANRLLTVPATGNHDAVVPPHWRQSWEWKRFMTLLDEIDGQNRLRELAEWLNQAEKDFRRANEQLVVEMTWRQLADMLPVHLASLKQYMIAIRKIGKGTGPKAAKYRREAREAMEVAVQAVPCWIMPHWRVSESLPATIGGFDLVILDEASQSNIMALPALLRAKKILIVGDDKQVSPVLVGKNTNTLLALEKKYLDSFQLGRQMRLESSVYQLAEVAFAMNNICLKQHFRCVEPIIQFSNHLCYRGELVPLRIPKPSERIDPPLVDVFVKDGYRHGSGKRNVPEAKALVREIAHLVGDPAYQGKSIGVVTLLGQNDQSKVINDLLWKVIGEEKILEHDIVVGEPPNFQGNEKDIMFLSLVDDANSGTAKTMEMWEQRYNVAASRARDRMYLYHSFRREDVPNPGDLRGKILDYFRNPLVLDKKKVESWRELCESEFERAVYDALVERGYYVRPQVRAGNYRIDMVVEGLDDRRLAVECDGDAFHGPERYYEDSVRQRMLERAGWNFWRCWGASFYRDPQGKLNELYDKLTEMGIEPFGAEGAPPPEIVEFREVLGEPEEADKKTPTGESVEDEEVQEPELSQAEPRVDSDEKTETEIFQEETPAQEVAAAPPSWLPLTVEVGDTVVYCDIEKPETKITLQILNSSTNVDYGIIGQNAPLAKALLGSELGEDVSFNHPRGVRIYRILDIVRENQAVEAILSN